MKRKLLVFASITVLAISLLAFASTGLLSGGPRQGYNSAEIYILSWDLNSTATSSQIDVQFRISVDADNDGDFELVRTSNVFHNSSVETVPYRLGTVVPTNVEKFSFKIDVLRVFNESSSPMHYQRSGVTPINTGVNEVNSSHVWKFDSTDGTESGGQSCRISYVYYLESGR